MATFEYDITYGGRDVSEGLSREVVRAIDQAIDGDLRVRRIRDRAGFDAVYQITLEDTVRLGIRSTPGKLEGTQEATIQLDGEERPILEVKQFLLNSVGGLELD